MIKKFIIGLNYDDVRYFIKNNPEFEFLNKKEQLMGTINPHVILSSKAFRRKDINELMEVLQTRMQ
jgi:hypothetical protein